MQVYVGRDTLKWVRLREIRHKNDVSERLETLATSSIQRALGLSILYDKLPVICFPL